MARNFFSILFLIQTPENTHYRWLPSPVERLLFVPEGGSDLYEYDCEGKSIHGHPSWSTHIRLPPLENQLERLEEDAIEREKDGALGSFSPR